MLSRENKAQKITRFSACVEKSAALVVAENAGLTAQDMEALRRKMRDSGGSAQVVKNTLAKRVLAGGKFAALADSLSGALVYGAGEDPAKLAKVFADLARDNPKFTVRGGVLADKAAMDAAAVGALAKLPPREQLLAQLMGTMQAPVAKFVGTLSAVPGGFARALAALRDQRADGGG